MTLLALGLVFSSAFFHAAWNYYSKKVKGGAAFIWLFSIASGVLYLPLAIALIVIEKPEIKLFHLGLIGVSALIHIGYYVTLNRGYRAGDLSLVYPLARGSGPMFATIAAIILLGERPSPIALFGTALIGLGVFILTGDPRRLRNSEHKTAVFYALMVGLFIATYTIWDKQTVAKYMVPPLILDWLSNVYRAILMSPVAWRRRDEVMLHWKNHRREALIVGLLSPLSYILVLTALTFSPVSYVAPLREISILIGTAMGIRLASEGALRQRLSGASVMLVGIIILTVSR